MYVMKWKVRDHPPWSVSLLGLGTEELDYDGIVESAESRPLSVQRVR